jgi:hypothetical protein
MIQYAHKGKNFEGWYNLKAFTTLEKAEQVLAEETQTKPDFKYCINCYTLEA